MQEEWRFKGNNYTTDSGLSTSDMETFKKDPLASFTRECFQNSIDAKREDKDKVIVKIKRFDIEKDKIPGCEQLVEEIERCIEYQIEKNNRDKEALAALNRIKEGFNNKTISCLKFSDYNTKGLCGVTNTTNSSFYLLTKGSGTTDKVGNDGGSKGIGKFSAFVESNVNTVFYSTKTINDEVGCIGISKLCSARIPNSDEKTIGIGYYGSDDKNAPILSQLTLNDENERTESGTDLYILGFDEGMFWKFDMTKYLLQSFLIAVYTNKLEVEIEDTIINHDNLEQIVNSLGNDNVTKIIKSQFYLISQRYKTIKKCVKIGDYGEAVFYGAILPEDKKEEASMKCTFIRYPYMRIKELKVSKSMPVSMMCIIEDNELNHLLRSIENPQHTDWETKRAKEYKNDADKAYKLLEEAMKSFYEEITKSSNSTQTDLVGAGKFLPLENLENNGTKNKIISKKPSIIGKRINKAKGRPASSNDNGGKSEIPDIGDSNEYGQESIGGNDRGKNSKESGGGDGNKPADQSGDKSIVKIVNLNNMKYRFIITNKFEGKASIIFNSIYDEDCCELQLFRMDDMNTTEKIDIINCFINGVKVNTKEFKLQKGKTQIDIITNIKELYACEVKLYASRK